MVKLKSQFVCQSCGFVYNKWVGKCESCGEWNTLVEEAIEAVGKSVISKSSGIGQKLKTQSIGSLENDYGVNRLKTGFGDLDLVLGGGLLTGGVVLLAGQPGIGKSTLLLQVCANIANSKPVLYVSGEESAGQVGLRAERLGAKNSESLEFASSTSADDIAATIKNGHYSLVVVDSVQTLSLSEISSSPGTVSQITNSSHLIIQAAKKSGSAVILVGHVTKEGGIAGPKVLEHIVDVVLQFEGDRYGGFKIVRAAKNRYGSTNEAAIFEMFDGGLRLVENPSEALLKERQSSDGSVVLATIEGNRPLLVEIQALVNQTSFGYPKRTASGFDINRLNLLIAVLEKRTKLKLQDKDIYVNVVGGIKLNDRAADLAVCMAIASASAQRQIDENYVVFGEIGLGGEIRSAFASDKRIQEAKKLGFVKAIAPKSTKKDNFVIGASNIREALIGYLK